MSQEQLTAFRKNNKQRRKVIAEKHGMSVEDYEAFLGGTKGKAKVPKKAVGKPTIHNVYILDASGSMGGLKLDNAIEGINSEIKELKKAKNADYTQTIVDFSSNFDIKRVFWKVPMNQMNSYHTRDRDLTALNQAIGETLESLLKENKAGEKTLVKIFTDGGENDSHGKYRNNSTVASLIKVCEKEGFTITFMGTKYDTDQVIKNLSVRASNTLVHDNTPDGIAETFSVTRGATMCYASDVVSGKDVTDNFYSKKVGKL